MGETPNDSPIKPSLKTRLWLRTLDRRPSSAAMYLEDEAGRLLIVKANYKKHWSLPGGLIDKNEMPLAAAIRETKEEVGLAIDPAEAGFVSVVGRRSSFFDSYQFVFAAPLRAYQLSQVSLQESEIDEYALVTRDEVKSGNRQYGRIIQNWADGKTGYSEQQLGN